MANVIKHKRGSGSDPSASNLVVGELAIRTDTGKLFTKMDSGAIAEIAGGGSDIAINTLSASSYSGGSGASSFNGSENRFTLSSPPNVSAAQLLVSVNGVIQKPVLGTGTPSEGFSVNGSDIIFSSAPQTGADFFILTFRSLGVSEPADNSVTSAKIVDGAIVNADINASAAIAGTKISPNFGSQAISTTGTLASGNLTITSVQPFLSLQDSNNENDFEVGNAGGLFRIRDVDAAVNRLTISSAGVTTIAGNLDVGDGIDVTGDVTVSNDLTLSTGDLILSSGQIRATDQIPAIFKHAVTGATACTVLIGNNTQTFAFAADSNGFSINDHTNTNQQRLFIDTSGNVGIGTNNPEALLNISGANNAVVGISLGQAVNTLTSSRYIGITQQNNANNLAANSGFQGIEFGGPGSTDEGYLGFHTHDNGVSSGERLRIDKSGNVGIGTSSPATLLEVSGSTPVLRVTGASTTPARLDLSSAGIVKWSLLSNDVSSALTIEKDDSAKFIIDTSGNVGIGTTSPSKKLEVNTGTASDGIKVLSDEISATLGVNNTGSNFARTATLSVSRADSGSLPFLLLAGQGGIQFASDINNERMRIDSNGNVGIGTTSPSDHLTVNHSANTAAGITITNTNNSQAHAVAQLLIAGGDNAKGRIKLEVGGAFHTIDEDSNGNLIIEDNGTERMRITSTGVAVVAGTSAFSDGTFGQPKLQWNAKTGNHAGACCVADTNNDIDAILFKTPSGVAGTIGTNTSSMYFKAGGNNIRMILSSTGDVKVATTTDEPGNGNTSTGITQRSNGRLFASANGTFSLFNRNTDSGPTLVFANAGTHVGNISVSSSATSYNSGSDYRLKENVTPISDGITRLKTLKPSRFNFKVDKDTTVDGFLAHEVTAVPEAITGTKDEVDADNNPVYQCIDQSKLVPLLVAALQEAIGRIEVLEAK